MTAGGPGGYPLGNTRMPPDEAGPRNNPTANKEYPKEFREKVVKYLTRDGNRLIRIGEFLNNPNGGGEIYLLI